MLQYGSRLPLLTRQVVACKDSFTYGHFSELGVLVVVKFHLALLRGNTTCEVRSHKGKPCSQLLL